MVTVALNDDAPLGPNDLRLEIDEDLFERFQAVAAGKGEAWDDLLIATLLDITKSVTLPADAALGAARNLG